LYAHNSIIHKNKIQFFLRVLLDLNQVSEPVNMEASAGSSGGGKAAAAVDGDEGEEKVRWHE